ncbi:hypothetical protein Sjap_013383 [Stephania japonica]|uniref:MIF4G domain-containing protein n=1 Tax=Stephania japonica TaxID=461633 RepID=A0AAP0J0A1_9MAGN
MRMVLLTIGENLSDINIKRNTTVIKKLKQINEEQKEGMIEELKSVNLTKFVSEAVTAICDAKLKTSDIQAAVQLPLPTTTSVAAAPESSLAGVCFTRVSTPSTVTAGPQAPPPCGRLLANSAPLLRFAFNANRLTRLASATRLFFFKRQTRIHLIEICSLLHQRYTEFSPCLIQGLLKIFFPGKSVDDLDADRNSKAMKRRSTLKLLLELYFFFSGLHITADHKKVFRKAFYTYYDAVMELLQSEHASLRHMEYENAKIFNAKGELSDENATSYEKQRKSFDHLFRAVASLAEALDMQPPVMPEDGHTTRVITGEDSSSSSAGKESSVLEPVWDDEDTRAFYECLPDLRAFVPAVLLGESEPKIPEQSAKIQEQQTELTIDQGQLTIQEAAEHDDKEKADEKAKERDDKEKEKAKDVDKEKGKEKDSERKGENEKDKLKGLEGTNLDGLLQRLPGCVSRDLIDQLTVEFCYLNSKSNRKRLVRALFNVPRTSLELLPYYSRMVATLSTCMKDVSSALLQNLEDEFNYLISKKACLDDFTHHNIDVACNLLETCGRFLYRSPETTIRMANMLEILMRLKNVKNLDPRHSTLVENAYYLCKPPERSARVSKVRPPLHQYIRKLLFSDLDKSSIEHVLRQLRKLPWNECEPYLLKCFMKVHKGKYSQVHLIASLTSGLSRYHDEFAVAVVDEVVPFFSAVLEEIRLGLESNDYGMQQRRIAHMRFLGELYNYEHIDSSVIFETLYLILIFGHGTPEGFDYAYFFFVSYELLSYYMDDLEIELQDELDPPEDCFRIRMIITLLQTCGHYFDRGSSKRKLDRFLIYFQRYILIKGSIPLDIEFDLQDLFADLRPKMTRYSAIEEVNAALQELEEHEHTASSDKINNERYSDAETSKRMGQTSSIASANGQIRTNGIEVHGRTHEDAVGDTESDSGSGSINPDVHEDEDELYEDKSENQDDESDSDVDDDDGGAHAASDEDEVQVRPKFVKVDPEEEAEFDRELRALMQESLDSRSWI